MIDTGRENNPLCIIIPIRGAASALEKTLLSIAAMPPCGLELKILIANDGADPAVTNVCLRHGVTMVAIVPRRGSYFARNRALEKISGELVVFLDAGIILPENWLGEALSNFGSADYMACEVDIAPISNPTAAEAYERGHSYPVADYMRIHHFGVTAGLVVSKRVLETIGGFDQRLFSGGDFEFGDRVHRAGFTQVYMAKPVLLHPPRRAFSFFRKQFRVKIGYGRLARLYPERFPLPPLSSSIAASLRALLPPHLVYIKNEFSSADNVGACRRFFFLWSLKICRAIAELAAAFVPAPRTRQSSTRIEWFDFSIHG